MLWFMGSHKVRHDWATGLTDWYSQSYSFSSSHVWMWVLDHKEGWAPKNWCNTTAVLEKTLESPLEITPVNLKGNQPWIIRLNAGGKGMTEDKMVGWHHWLNGQEFEQPLGDGEGQGSRVYCSPWGRKELEVTERLNKASGGDWNPAELFQILKVNSVKVLHSIWQQIWRTLWSNGYWQFDLWFLCLF